LAGSAARSDGSGRMARGRRGLRASACFGRPAPLGEEAARSARAARARKVHRMTAPQRELIDDCVHCGFCLPHCPTYQSRGEEMDAPRRRIDLMRGLRTGKTQMTPTVAAHFDRCLGCMACVTACPSGVRYDVLIEETRAYVEKTYRRGFLDRLHRSMIFQLFPYPGRLRAMA